jgi:acetyl-CoA hydrolase
MTNLLLSLQAAGQMSTTRGLSLLDGPHWHNTCRCADDGFVSIASLGPKSYRELCDRLELACDPAFEKPYA